jgi:large subunit ribosomal protein L9
MKVLFLQNLEHHNVGDIKNIPDGYVRNFLLPKGIVVTATDENINNYEKKIEKLKKEEEKLTGDLEKLKEEIESKNFTISAQAGDENKLFGAITNRDISEILAKDKIVVDRHDIEILNPIHELGEHEVTAKLGHGIHATIHLRVERAK